MKGFHFEKAIDPYETAKSVDLPESVERGLVSEDPESPLNRITERLRHAGVALGDIERYREAMVNFLEHRPSKVKFGMYTQFVPQEHYFAPLIYFGSDSKIFPLASGRGEQSLKPRLSRENIVREREITGEEALETFKSEGDSRGPVTPQEKFLTSVNRFIYALHEPLHVLQALVPGDRLNRVKDKIGADVFVHSKERNFLLNPKNASYDIPEVFREFAATPFYAPESENAGAENQSTILVTNNEATMDVLADISTSQLLREQPALLWNLHNSMVVVIEALREIKARALTFSETDVDNLLRDPAFLYLEKRSKQVRNYLGFLGRMYFAAFESSDDALTYLRGTDQKVLGRNVSGALLTSQAFDAFEAASLEEEVRILIEAPFDLRDTPYRYRMNEVIRPYHFPSGAVHLQRQWIETKGSISEFTFEYPAPITRQGAELVGKVFIAAAKLGMKGGEIKNLLNDLDAVAEKKDKAREIREKIKAAVGLDLSEEDVREMYGAQHYLFIENFRQYPKRFYLRKEILRQMEKEDPKTVDSLIRSCFFELPISEEEFLALSGFGRQKTPRQGYGWERIPLDSLEHFLKTGLEHSFSIFGIDSDRLSAAEISRILELSNKMPHTEAEMIEILKNLADIRRAQLQQAKE